MKWSKYGAILVVLNVGLLAAVGILLFKLRHPLPLATPVILPAAPAKSAALRPEEQPLPLAAETNSLTWQQLESEDYRTYIERLRAIGCPEQTIRDIITAEGSTFTEGPPWLSSARPRHLWRTSVACSRSWAWRSRAGDRRGGLPRPPRRSRHRPSDRSRPLGRIILEAHADHPLGECGAALAVATIESDAGSLPTTYPKRVRSDPPD